MAWTLWCAVLNDGAVFCVEIEPQDLVLELQEAVARKMRYTEPAHQLRLFLAKKKDGAWLEANDSDVVRLQSSGRCPTKMYDLLQPELFLSPANTVQDAIPMGSSAPTSSPVIHMLVKKPGLQEPTTLWAFNGSIGNTLKVEGTRVRVYFLAEWFGGYYDPSLRTASAGDKALWYDGDALQISLLFEKGK